MSMIATPLRYPGGKSSLTNYLRLVLNTNDLRGGHYVEPYCGGAGAAVALLRAEAVSHVHINDIDPAIHAFWHTLLHHPQVLVDFVGDVPLTVEEWRRQREIYQEKPKAKRTLAKAFFYLNRVNRSGILNGGLIGGLEQTGAWLMDARFNRSDLIDRIERIAAFRDAITLTSEDALELLKSKNRTWPKRTLIYLDPPYFNKGQCLYRNSYQKSDHASIASYLRRLTKRAWLASYDSTPEIHKLYKGLRRQEYTLDYTARSRSKGSEVVIFGASLVRPAVENPMSVEKSLVLRAA